MQKFINFCLILVLISGCNSKKRENTAIAILPLGLEDAQSFILNDVKKSIAENKQFKVIVLPESELPKAALNDAKKRYRAAAILKYLKSIKPDSVDCILAITSADISTIKDGKDWGIFGLGAVGGVASVVSLFRLGDNKTLLKKRVLKICKHELGHNFGLAHCKKTKTCVMNPAEGSIRTVDRVNNAFCKNCQDKLRR